MQIKLINQITNEQNDKALVRNESTFQIEKAVFLVGKIFAVRQMKHSLVNIVVLRLVKRPFANIFIFFFGWQSLFKGWNSPLFFSV